jgi:hypothetical protein
MWVSAVILHRLIVHPLKSLEFRYLAVIEFAEFGHEVGRIVSPIRDHKNSKMTFGIMSGTQNWQRGRRYGRMGQDAVGQ